MSIDPLGGLPEEPAPPPPAVEERAAPPPLPRHSSIVMLTILALFFLAEGLVSKTTTVDDSSTLFRMGALFVPAFQHGDWWRVGAYAFLHIGWLHIVMNGAALWALMPQIEATYGPNLAIGIFSATALCAGGASAGWAIFRGASTLVAGASGGIFGLFGATIALFWRLRHRIPPEPRRRIMRSIAGNLLINAVIAFSGYVDNAAHIGGLVTGVLFGLIAPLATLPRKPWHAPVKWALIGSALGLFAMEGAAVAWAVRPKPRTLRGPGVVAQIPGMFVPLADDGTAEWIGADARLAIGRAEPSEDATKIQLGQHTFLRERFEKNEAEFTQLAAEDGAGVILRCADKRCRGASGEELVEKVAATLHQAP